MKRKVREAAKEITVPLKAGLWDGSMGLWLMHPPGKRPHGLRASVAGMASLAALPGAAHFIAPSRSSTDSTSAKASWLLTPGSSCGEAGREAPFSFSKRPESDRRRKERDGLHTEAVSTRRRTAPLQD